MRTVRQLLEGKASGSSPPEVFAVGPDEAVIEAIRLMAEKRMGAVLVMEDGHRLVGILSERDYARKVALLGRTSDQTRVRDVMTDAVLFVEPSQTTDACMQLMTSKRLRHLPVMDGGQLVGLISIGDLVKQIISAQQFTIAQLEHYIHGGVHS